MTPLRICLVASEVAPFAKTGGLADVSAAVAKYLHGAGHDVRLVMPRYRTIEPPSGGLTPDERVRDVRIRFGEHSFTFSASTARLPGSDLDVTFLECPELYDRDRIYTSDADEHLRFALLCRGAIELCQWLHWPPDCFHCNDWHTGLLPLYLRVGYDWDRLFAGTKTLLTIHNIGYQGVFSTSALVDLGLDQQAHLLHSEDVAKGQVNFLKTGVLYADAVSTVSETYAREIQTSELGMGLEGLLQARSDTLVGIVNGVDYSEWSPEHDPLIDARYSASDLSGKARNKRALLAAFDLEPVAGDAPVLLAGIVSRLVAQKGVDLLPDVLPVLLQREDMRLVVLGAGEERYEQYFQWLRDTFPRKVAFYRGYENRLAHRIEAASDAFLMPSRYEPCGLNQMYSLRYGTIPIVRRTGGLADTVQPFDRASRTGTGFVFDDFSSEALYGAITEALGVFADREAWAALMSNAMAVDFSWEVQGRHYVELYRRLVGH